MKTKTLLKRASGFRRVEFLEANTRPVANQVIIQFENMKIFQSYDSIIAIIVYLKKESLNRDNQIYLGKNWDYSKTTGRYRNQFLNETKKETEAKIESGEYKLLEE